MENEFYYNAIAVQENANYGDLKKINEKYNGDWKSAYERYIQDNHIIKSPEKEWNKILELGVQLILSDSPKYPKLLKEIYNPPFGIYIIGEIQENEKIPISIVGTRKATNEGKNISKKFSRKLNESGFLIISGLAFGIDISAHESCVELNQRTIAVIASGVDNISPRSNYKIAKKILDNSGAIISEYPIGAKPFPNRFIERNRIISGLSKGILIIEAPKSSGALITARFATEQNRDIFVVPGSINNQNYVGSNNLIKNGAQLVTSPQDILDAYGIKNETAQDIKAELFSNEEKIILDVIKNNIGDASIDKIIMITKLEAQIVNQTISFLLIKDIIEENEYGYNIKID
jgi:DNA processing protein